MCIAFWDVWSWARWRCSATWGQWRHQCEALQWQGQRGKCMAMEVPSSRKKKQLAVRVSVRHCVVVKHLGDNCRHPSSRWPRWVDQREALLARSAFLHEQHYFNLFYDLQLQKNKTNRAQQVSGFQLETCLIWRTLPLPKQMPLAKPGD